MWSCTETRGAAQTHRVACSNLLKRTVDVVESLGEVRGVLTTGPTKTGKRRTVTLPGFLAEMIGAHIGTYPSRDRLVFTAAEGGPIVSPIFGSGISSLRLSERDIRRVSGSMTSGTPAPQSSST